MLRGWRPACHAPRSADTDKQSNTRQTGEDREMTRRVWAALIAAAMGLALAVPVLAAHNNDPGQDEAWTNDMNQTSYWEARFGAECTKYENHSGYIPSQYTQAVVKDGNYVRVYDPAPSPFWALGAVNPQNDKHFKAPHSWVMKCKVTPETTTTTTPEETTTTQPEETTTTTEQETTTTTEQETTTTTAPTPITLPCVVDCGPPDSIPEVVPDPEPVVTTPPATTPPELPFTGPADWLIPLGYAGLGMLIAGSLAAWFFRDRLS